MQKVLLACAGIEQKTQQMVVLTPKDVKKKGEEEDVCYPYRSNKKDDMRLF